jgi:hypothetical protein
MPDLSGLDMGIHSDGGVVWLPKHFQSERNKVKQWAVDNGFTDTYVDTRVRTVWCCEDDEAGEPGWYIKCLPDLNPDAIECWEIE